MFEISFPELVILAVIALLVLGPERLPKAARFAGLWVRRARAHWHSVKSEFERELADEELRHNLEATRKALAEAENELRQSASNIEQIAREAAAPAAAAPVSEPAAPPSALAADAARRDDPAR
ncbi:twin-arginine translocase subunit TatB [Lysobacter pythonis]|uniref:Sec-independent protein translocase protein TatB n=1 Tax=Solilutibacter pythonis TaxID=2483112 RepID=A0A3M2HGL4_9GAMM|nr:Sec-independent protein translocase protein TatB [Lysobacter pythonis]RMH88108.1 twin-arginine translocase subunit TatB [Lysobacter pythonis]